MRVAEATPLGILPLPAPTQHALAAAWALQRAHHLLAPVGIPEDLPPPDVPGARAAFLEAVLQLKEALTHAGGRPGHLHVEAALEEAQEALVRLARPGVHPPIAAVIDNAWRGAELARTAVDLFNGADAWAGPAPMT